MSKKNGIKTWKNGFTVNLPALGKEDESGAGGLWDYAGQIAVNIGVEHQNDSEPVNAEEWGQEQIYVALTAVRDAMSDHFKNLMMSTLNRSFEAQ